jgi:hypothetical protein
MHEPYRKYHLADSGQWSVVGRKALSGKKKMKILPSFLSQSAFGALFNQ